METILHKATKFETDLQIEEVNESNKSEWEHYVDSNNKTTFVDSWAWRELVSSVYRLPHFWYMAKNRGKIEGILGLTLSRHPILGKYLATAPFGSQGGFYADSERAFHALFTKAGEIHDQCGAKYTVIRHLESELPPPEGWVQCPTYSVCQLPLIEDIDYFNNKHLRQKERKPIKKGLRSGFRVQFGKSELLDDFWHVISLNMKNLGSPYHSKKYLITLMHILGEQAEIATLYSKDNQPAAASLILYHNDTAILLHSHALKEYRIMRPADLMWWFIICECYRKGIKCLDLGRSIVGSGNERFKMKFRPIRKTLASWYRLSPGTSLPHLNQDNPRYQLPIKIWRRTPLWLTSLIGPNLMSGIL